MPELRAALFHVAVGMRTVEQLDGAEDPVGRPAIELRITTEGYVHELFFDPATFQLMALKETPGDGGGEHFTPWYVIVEMAGFTSSTSEVPGEDDLFFPPPQTELPEF